MLTDAGRDYFAKQGMAVANGQNGAEQVDRDNPGPQEPQDAQDDDENDGTDIVGGTGRKSIATQLVEMARQHYALGMSDTEEPFGTAQDRPHIARMLRGGRTGLRAELAQRHFRENGTAASQQALADACMVLEGYAAQEAQQRVHLRVARREGVVYLDMGDDAGRVIEMSAGKWSITSTGVPVLFRRTKLTSAQVDAAAEGDLARLREFVPINDESWPLLLAWLVAALIAPDVAHTVLALIAEHGMAKSSITRCLVDLIDPSPVPLRQAPRDQQGWTTAASASWVVALDNLSGELPSWLSDCLCRAATGDGDVRRQLYTDNDVSVLAFRRAVIFNGVDVQVTQGDLADRLLRIDLERITTRLTDEELASQWSQARPVILAGLLDLAAAVHDQLGKVVVQNLPRMADFARVLAAVDALLDTQGLDYYREQHRRLAADTLDDPFTAALIKARLDVRDKTSAEIRRAVSADAERRSGDVDWKEPKGWPKRARDVTAQLTRNAPALREQGWSIDHDGGRNKDRTIKWTIRRPEKVGNPDPPHPPNPPSQVKHQKAGGSDDSDNPPTSPPNPPTTSMAGNKAGQAGKAKPGNPPQKHALNSSNGSAGQAGLKHGQSLDAEQPSGFTPPAGPDRCSQCGFHIPTQGHHTGCAANHDPKDTT